jgi:hypothetical protein
VPTLGYRDSPRPRHDLPPRVVSLLRPFFRYSDWRDAWVLRLVGERFGPVIQPAPGHEPPPARLPRLGPSPVRWPTAIGVPATLLLLGGIAVAAVLGFVIARSTTGGGSGVALAKPVSAGTLEVSFPNGWLLHPARQGPGYGPIDGIIASSGGSSIEVGTATTTDPSLLTPAILAAVPNPPTARLVTLRGTTFYRYPGLHTRVGAPISIYATPTQDGTVLALCQPSGSPPSGANFASLCQQVVESIRVRSGSLAPGLVPSYASALSAMISRLNTALTIWDAKLSTAQTARLQAYAATQLAAAHTQAAAALSGLHPGPAQSSNNNLVASLRADADAYNALANAAANRRPRAYRTSAAAVAQANAAVSSALAALGRFGYRVS